MLQSADGITEVLRQVALEVARFVRKERWDPRMAEEAGHCHEDDTYTCTRLDLRAGDRAYALLRERLADSFIWCTEDQEHWGEGPPEAELVIVADPLDGTAFSLPARPDYGACCLTAFHRDATFLACVVADLYSPTVFWCDGYGPERPARAFLQYRSRKPWHLQIPDPYPRKSLWDGCYIASVLAKPDRLQDGRDKLDKLEDYLVRGNRERSGPYATLLALTFGGSPTIARVAATGLSLGPNGGPSPVPCGVDVCFDIVGGRFHDLAGPVEMVRAAGGVALHLGTGEDLELRLPLAETREDRHPFVIAATRRLAEELLEVIG